MYICCQYHLREALQNRGPPGWTNPAQRLINILIMNLLGCLAQTEAKLEHPPQNILRIETCRRCILRVHVASTIDSSPSRTCCRAQSGDAGADARQRKFRSLLRANRGPGTQSDQRRSAPRGGYLLLRGRSRPHTKDQQDARAAGISETALRRPANHGER